MSSRSFSSRGSSSGLYCASLTTPRQDTANKGEQDARRRNAGERRRRKRKGRKSVLQRQSRIDWTYTRVIGVTSQIGVEGGPGADECFDVLFISR